MSSLTYLDPSFDSSGLRAEFRVPIGASGVYKNDMRILNVGVAKTNNGNSVYNKLTGGYGIIRSIEIFNGAQLLDQVQEFGIYVGIKNLLNSNHDNMSVNRSLRRNKLGYVAAGDNEVTDGGYAAGVFISANAPDLGNIVYGNDAAAVNKPENGTWLDLSDCLGFLRSSPYIPMNVYPDLRIVITYARATQLGYMIRDQTATLTTLRPLLVCESEPDMDIAEKLMNAYQGVSFESVEHDVIVMPSNAAGADQINTQETSAIVKGFNNKYISKMIVVHTPTVATTWVAGGNASSFANSGSVAQLDWKYQARINGQNVFPGSYKEGAMRRLGCLTDIWGDQNVAFGQNWAGASGGGDKFMNADIRDTIGQASYDAIRLDDIVSEFKLSLQRGAVGKGPAGNATDNENLRQQLNLNIYGISRKQIIPTDTGLVIRYV